MDLAFPEIHILFVSDIRQFILVLFELGVFRGA
jgi:hypothetical protein